MGFPAGFLAGVLGHVTAGGPPLPRRTWTLALVLAVSFGVAEFVRCGRVRSRQPQAVRKHWQYRT